MSCGELFPVASAANFASISRRRIPWDQRERDVLWTVYAECGVEGDVCPACRAPRVVSSEIEERGKP